MFSTLGQKIILTGYIFLILSIPLGSYFVSNYQTSLKSKASEPKKTTATKIMPSPQSSAKQELSDLAKKQATPKPSPTPQASPGVTTSFGPTLSLKANLEGRPKDDMATRLFVGVVEGVVSINPKFLLIFTIDLPKSGEYASLSLAGLNPGTSYSALLKGSAQIATSSAFLMSPTVTNLNNGQALNMLTGDLNEDNAINSSDYSIVKALLGISSKSSNWNENADFNKDKIINSFDLAIVTKNLGKAGASGTWTSPIPKAATPSGGLTEETTQSATGGYWIWVPK